MKESSKGSPAVVLEPSVNSAMQNATDRDHRLRVAPAENSLLAVSVCFLFRRVRFILRDVFGCGVVVRCLVFGVWCLVCVSNGLSLSASEQTKYWLIREVDEAEADNDLF